ncbi:hypothetical protein [Nannocystis punicea]|uniref:DUF4156 domain-containing protein n=1 Tax=Nannocystis punicea TaxID=2995304 RepID=A0ABY7H4T4_9BACT|nr:hypothetical protein [Nannocystis poenicansa]WAS94090.1 hypothetical protein O0S08_48825 [Nannocystis poenicansa]
MRKASRSLLLFSLALALGACAGGYSGKFKGNGTGARVPASQVKTVANKDALGDTAYTTLGTAIGKAPTAQEAVDMAKQHCGMNGGNLLILNTEPYQSGSRYIADAACATDGSAPKAANTAGKGKPAR